MRTISHKLILAFLLVAVIAAVLVAVVIRLTSPARLNVLLRDQASSKLEMLLVDYYTVHGSFDGVTSDLQSGGFLPPSQQQHLSGQPFNSTPSNRLAFTLVDENGMVITSMLPDYTLGTALSADSLAGGQTLVVNGQAVGTIITPPEALFSLAPEERAFLNLTNRALWLAAIGAIAAALVMGVLLARTFARPLGALTSAARRMADGELEQDVPVSSQDEIGELTQAFNSMSRAVSRANQLRQQMTADIAHDLRTPLTVIGGYIESMQEGVLAPTPERLDIIRSEIERLQRMVEDLRTLSHADAGELTLTRQVIPPGTLLEHMAAIYHHPAGQKEITLKTEIAEGLPDIQVDEARMVQVIGNLIDNALRFTPEGGTITLSASRVGEGVSLCVQDSGPGIQAGDLPHVFERFYRADKSRSMANGASGLGLAIARALITAHGGNIRAESTPGTGTRMIINLSG